MDKYKALLKDLEEFRDGLNAMRKEYRNIVNHAGSDYEEFLGKEIAFGIAADKLTFLINKHESK